MGRIKNTCSFDRQYQEVGGICRLPTEKKVRYFKMEVTADMT